MNELAINDIEEPPLFDTVLKTAKSPDKVSRELFNRNGELTEVFISDKNYTTIAGNFVNKYL